MLGWLSSIKEGIGSLAESIKTGIKDVLLEIFVPDEDFITEKLEELKQEFVFAESIINTADQLKNAMSSTTFSDEFPVIYMDLSAAESKYDYGGRTVALDFSWFARYKPLTDTIISGILWALLIWRMFVLLPGIINGTSGMIGNYSTFEKNMSKKDKEK